MCLAKAKTQSSYCYNISNNDYKITARELNAFIKDKEERQSQFRQTPELQVDKDRVIVQLN